MIQFNLLPDVKLEYIKATYRRRIVATISFVAAGAFLTIFILIFLFVRVNQTRNLSNLDKQINESLTKLQENKDLDKVLTIQNQLNSLPGLHEQKVMSSRMFGYLSQVTPTKAAITNVDASFESSTITIKGLADTIGTVNKFVDTLKFTNYTVAGENAEPVNAFNSVVLNNFKLESADGGEDAVTYEISFTYDPKIFANSAKEGKPLENSVKLNVPSIISTRSETQKPNSLFTKSNDSTTEDLGGGQ